jgi:hypothetical protein
MSHSSAPDPATLGREIAQLETEAARLDIERAAISRSVRTLARRSRYLRLARWFRSPGNSFAGYPFTALAIAPIAFGVAAMVFVSLLVSGWSLPFGGFLFGWLIGLFVCALLLFRPADALLAPAVTETEAKLRSERIRLEHVATTKAELQTVLTQRNEERRHVATGDKLQRAMLLQRNWKAMQGAEWEDFVVEVCRTLGANVHRGPSSGPMGGHVPPPPPGSGARGVVRRPIAPFFVTFSPRRYAVAAVSEIRPFHTAAVQQIVAELGQHGADALAIITNTRLTTGSQELARSRNCTLIGEDEFPDFVLGKTTL